MSLSASMYGTIGMTNRERLRQITDSIEKGIRELFESDRYKNYLTTMSRFHRYSVNNQMLIYMQRPDATHVAGYTAWHDRFGRDVRKGERGISIIAPSPIRKTVGTEKTDPATGKPVLGPDGKAVMEEKEITVPRFRPVTVFDISQTEGKPLPQLAADLQGEVKNYELFFEAVKRSSPVPVVIEPMARRTDGFFDLEHRNIHLREGMSEVQTVSAALHEIAHSLLHDRKRNAMLESRETYENVILSGEEGLFTNGRIDRSKLPEGLFCYDLRESDGDPGAPRTLEEHVTVNHAGCVITARPLDLGEAGRIDAGETLEHPGGSSTLKEFYEKMHPEKAVKSKNTEEVEAESVSYAVCAYYGISTGENSFGYIAAWSRDKELGELRASLETINKTSSGLISDIGRHYAEIVKERGLDGKETGDGDLPPWEEEKPSVIGMLRQTAPQVEKNATRKTSKEEMEL